MPYKNIQNMPELNDLKREKYIQVTQIPDLSGWDFRVAMVNTV